MCDREEPRARPSFVAANGSFPEFGLCGKCAGRYVASASRKSAARSPIMIADALVFDEGIVGITEASATRSLSTP